MTRLVSADIDGLGTSLPEYEAFLRRLTGKGLAGIAAHARVEGQGEAACVQALESSLIGIVPVSYGEGVISGFTEALRDIVTFLGADGFITRQANILGMAEAVERGASMLLLSDDDDFMALNLRDNRTSHNSEATGQGFAAALALMAEGLEEKEVLVVGAGPVGSAATAWIDSHGGRCLIHDHSIEAARRLAQSIPGARIADQLEPALARCDLVIEATPAANLLRRAWLRPEHRIAAPGVPLGVETGAEHDLQALAGGHIVHDRLEIGVATMLFAVVGP
ncbi:MAG: 3-methylornithyl-N6-L-lysine dehydrogenase PylD [Desulfobulbus sp.]